MARSKLGPIPDDHFENDPSPTAQNQTPLSQELLDKIAALKQTMQEEAKSRKP
ncbi:hypothetical protein IVB25_23510 [Bradyrhizobium sp. 193]|uniref:hypothetical protein n=1 Tax=Bradyrhizobium sp. 193 TaxID=2782661 RepID=UPI001FF8479F|nr:hypothetical protein [Bradyrhizobium sp. 193]MCK1485577.1 hypothetical protein [Bradyrhizobium sp. 193]